MIKEAIKFLASIVISFLFLRFGYMMKNDYLSIGMQIIGYIIIVYPFYVFFSLFIGQIKFDLKERKKDKQFYSQSGGVYGGIYVKGKPLSGVKCVVKNPDGSLNEWSYRWIGLTNKDGYFEVSFVPNGEWVCEFSHTFMNGRSFIITRDFEVKNNEPTHITVDID